MQNIQNPKVAKLFTRPYDAQGGLQHIPPHTLTGQELRRYAELVSPKNLPENWKEEILKRRIGRSTSSKS